MVRDTIKNEEYFIAYIQNTLKRKNAYIAKINTLENPKQGFINSSVTLDLFSRNILIAKYSLGENISNLLPDYEESIKWFLIAYNSTAFYVQLLWTLSIGIMINKDKVFIAKLIELVKKDDPCDFLIDFILKNNSSWDKQRLELKFSTPYNGLIEVIEIAKTDKQKAVERLKKYLEKEWYKGHSDTGWHNNHNSKHATYCGYWSFESGVIVKILNLDDDILKGVKYYPYDMVHWNK
jgi:hypothetical protein